MYTSVYQCIPVYSSEYQCIAVYSSVYLSVLPRAAEHGVRTTSVCQPTIDYPDLSQVSPGLPIYLHPHTYPLMDEDYHKES